METVWPLHFPQTDVVLCQVCVRDLDGSGPLRDDIYGTFLQITTPG